MKRIKINIPNVGENLTAWQSDNHPDFALRSHGRGGWSVTHKPTGHSASGLRVLATRKAAEAWVAKLTGTEALWAIWDRVRPLSSFDNPYPFTAEEIALLRETLR